MRGLSYEFFRVRVSMQVLSYEFFRAFSGFHPQNARSESADAHRGLSLRDRVSARRPSLWPPPCYRSIGMHCKSDFGAPMIIFQGAAKGADAEIAGVEAGFLGVTASGGLRDIVP